MPYALFWGPLISNSSGKTVYWGSAAILCAGFAAGLAAAYAFNSIPFHFGADVIKAKELGITSLTIQAGYSKTKDTLTYASVLGFPVIFAFGLWLIWADGKRRGQLTELFAIHEGSWPGGDLKPKGWAWRISLFAFLALYLSSVNLWMFRGTPLMNDWAFLSEEGVNLAWAEAILKGKVFGKDFFCLYGPMLLYPIAWAMKIFGAKIVVERAYTFLLNFAAYGIITGLLYKALRSILVFIVSALVFFGLYMPFVPLTPHTSYMRFALALLPILLIYVYSINGKKIYLVLAGLAAGQSLLFSQEAGLCSVIAVVGFFALSSIQAGDKKRLLRNGGVYFVSLFVSIFPMLGYLLLKGALGAFFGSLYGYPKLVLLGFSALPFPDFVQFMKNPFSGDAAIVPFWILLVYAFTAVYLLPLVVLKKMGRRHMLMAALLIFGVLFFRYGLGRADFSHIFPTLPPALVLALMFADGALAGTVSQRGFMRIGKGLLLTGVLVSLALLLRTPVLEATMSEAANSVTDTNRLRAEPPPPPKNLPCATGAQQIRYAPLDLPRTGPVYVNESTAKSVEAIQKFLNENLRPGELVYFFPNEPMYYFLFDLPPPTKYVMSTFAITTNQRYELVSELERTKPMYAIYSKNTEREDDIPARVYAPEVLSYLNRKYRPVLETDDLVFGKRVDF